VRNYEEKSVIPLQRKFFPFPDGKRYFAVFSAGIRTLAVNPIAIMVMEEILLWIQEEFCKRQDH